MSKAEVKISAGDAAIALSVAGKASNAEFLKALWSIRGDLHVQVAGSDLRVPVVKASLVNLHKGLPADEPAEFALKKIEGSTEYEVRPAKKASKRVEKPADQQEPQGQPS